MARATNDGPEEVRHLHRLARLNVLVLDDDFVAPQEDWAEPPATQAVAEPDLQEWFSALDSPNTTDA